MNILVIGSGGREHTFCWKLSQSPKCTQLFVAPGNAGTASLATNLPIQVNDFEKIKQAVLQHQIDLVVVGPEDPLVRGIHDFFLADAALASVKLIGPSKLGATLEGSKEFAKEFMFRHQIPTAPYQSFTAENVAQGLDYLASIPAPYVLKADGLAAGKGVLILQDLKEAQEALKEMLLDKKFGEASTRVVVEGFLDGIELSCFVLTDGQDYVTFPMAKDYKRIGEGDTGLNTGGMGAISPVPFADKHFIDKIEKRIVKPTIDGLQKDNIPYVGFVFIGLIKVGDDPFVIEYNVRMGDPETEVVLPRIQNDLVDLLWAAANKTLKNVEIKTDPRAATTVVAVSGGYPEAYEKRKVISGLEQVTASIVFHAGTSQDEAKTLTNGGRVLAVTSYGENYTEALKKSYESLKQIKFEGMYYRSDLGFDL